MSGNPDSWTLNLPSDEPDEADYVISTARWVRLSDKLRQHEELLGAAPALDDADALLEEEAKMYEALSRRSRRL